MGLAVLPARLKKEMAALKQEWIKGTEDISGIEEIKSHAAWYKEIRAKNPEAKPEDLDKVLKYEIGKVFETVLTHAGVYKRTPEGMAAFDRFMQVVTK
jgi:UDPglucose--hexose-1-phosphate uridylyltransferase